MSTSLHPSAWEDPLQFAVPLPFEVDPLEHISPHLISSDTHFVLGYKNRVYIYSLPSFALIHMMETGTLIFLYPIRISKGMLIVLSEEDESKHLVSLHIWDLVREKLIGTVKTSGDKFGKPNSGFSHDVKTQVAKLDDNAEWERSKDSMLILYCYGADVFETYVLPDVGGQGPSSMLPATKMRSIHRIQCLGALGRAVLTGGYDSTVRVWDVITGECQLVLIGHADCVSDVFLNENRIYSASFDGTTRVWDRHSGDCLQVLDMAHAHSNGIRFLDIAPSHLITRDLYNIMNIKIWIWNPISGKPVRQIPIQHITFIAQALRGKQCILVITEMIWDSNEQWIRVWDTTSGKILAQFSTCSPGRLLSWHAQLLHCFQDGFLLALVEEDERFMLKVWDFGDHESPETGVDTNERTHSDAIPAVDMEFQTTTRREKGKCTDTTGYFTKDNTERTEKNCGHLSPSHISADEEVGGVALSGKHRKGKGKKLSRLFLQSRRFVAKIRK